MGALGVIANAGCACPGMQINGLKNQSPCYKSADG